MAAYACWQRTIVDASGDVVAGASIRVQIEGTNALATLYSDRAGTVTLTNPFPADSNGFAQFFVRGGAYKITASKSSFTQIWRYVGIGTASEKDIGDLTAQSAGLTPKGDWAAGTGYEIGDAVENSGSGYICITAHTSSSSSEPSIGADWQEVWMLLVSKGDAGATGAKGDKGDTGAQGSKGDTGDQGPQGEQGPKGDTGTQGPQGETGPQGNTGAQGPKGDSGTSFEPNARGTFAERSGHDVEAADFCYLSIDGDGDTIETAVLFFKLSATPGDWSIPTPFQGPKGDTGTIADGDRGDIVVSDSGSTWSLKDSIVTDAARSVLNQSTVAAMLAALGGASALALQVFTSSDTYTPTTGMKYCLVISTGAGAGGGGAGPATENSLTLGAGGGAAGTCIGLFSAAQVGSSQSITIGSSGSAGSDSGGDGGNGGNTSFGSLHTANGGVKGGGGGQLADGSTNLGAPGAGGTSTGGAINIPGGKGDYGQSGSIPVWHGGEGGDSFWGQGGRGGPSLAIEDSVVGQDGLAPGAGGGGALCVNSATGAVGGVGGPGIVLVLELA
jgi:hypothetical protein